MKKMFKLLLGVAAMLAMALIISCEGPAGADGIDGKDGAAGAAGTAGAAGINGENGSDGKDGVDGNLSCLECHTATKMNDIATAFATTKHVTGSSWGRGTSASCGRCHSHDGYEEFVRSGNAIAAAISTPVECQTCHADHSSLEDGIDAPLKMIDEVIAVVDNTIKFNHGKGNVCATCHQSRTNGSAYDKYTVDKTFSQKFTGADIAVYTSVPNSTSSLNATNDTLTVVFNVPTTHVYVNSTHAGPHHGPQANMFAGIVGYPANGGAFDRNGHTDCTGCHLNDKDATGASHTFSPNIDQCNVCHDGGTDLEGLMADNQADIDALVLKCVELKLLGLADGAAAPYTVDKVHPMYSSSTRAQFQGFYNTMCLLEDKSKGIHNPDYAKSMIATAKAGLGL